jgi:hypothetical protein
MPTWYCTSIPAVDSSIWVSRLGTLGARHTFQLFAFWALRRYRRTPPRRFARSATLGIWVKPSSLPEVRFRSPLIRTVDAISHRHLGPSFLRPRFRLRVTIFFHGRFGHTPVKYSRTETRATVVLFKVTNLRIHESSLKHRSFEPVHLVFQNRNHNCCQHSHLLDVILVAIMSPSQ